MKSVFISYAHLDNQPMTPGQKGWVEKFHDALEARVAQHLGEGTQIWFDPSLTGNDEFSERILQGLAEAKILVSVVTPRYVKSAWCLREAETFCAAAKRAGTLLVEGKFRVFKVVKTPLENDAVIPPPLEEPFKPQLGYPFYQDDGKVVREYNEEFGESFKVLFNLKVDDLAHDISKLLKLLHGQPAPSKSALGKTIYLATTTSDCREERDRIQRELEERGHRVRPPSGMNWPDLAAEAEQAVREQLKGADLSIHLIGKRYGAVPEGADCSILELQNRLAAEESGRSSLGRFIWLPKDLQTEDGRQAAFVRALREDANAQRGAELVQDMIEKLKELVLNKLIPPAPVAPAPPPVPGGAPTVYLVCDQGDEAAADPVEDFLRAQHLSVARPAFDGTPAEFSEAHRRHLQDCDGVLIYYGASSGSWVNIKQSDIKQAPGYGRTKPFLARAVCVAPPEDRNKQRFRPDDLEVIRMPAAFSPESLVPFVQRLKGQAAGPA